MSLRELISAALLLRQDLPIQAGVMERSRMKVIGMRMIFLTSNLLCHEKDKFVCSVCNMFCSIGFMPERTD